MSSVTEDYLKKIYMESQKSVDEYVAMGTLAQSMGLTAGTITSMMKNMHKSDLVEYLPRVGVKLSREGQKQAIDVLRKHRLIEQFLVEILKLDWKYIHEEADILEHALSERIINRIDSILGHPLTDPHGDPIPRSDGTMPQIEDKKLMDFQAGDELVITRIKKENSEFLDFLSASHLKPAERIHFIDSNNASGIVTLRTKSGDVSISLDAASHIRARYANG